MWNSNDNCLSNYTKNSWSWKKRFRRDDKLWCKLRFPETRKKRKYSWDSESYCNSHLWKSRWDFHPAVYWLRIVFELPLNNPEKILMTGKMGCVNRRVKCYKKYNQCIESTVFTWFEKTFQLVRHRKTWLPRLADTRNHNKYARWCNTSRLS